MVGDKALELRYLSYEDDDAAVACILGLSDSIFKPESESHHTSLEEWRKRLSDPASSIIYLALRPNDQLSVSSRYLSPVGFIFAHPRSHPEPLKSGYTQSLHIWLAGVLEEYRGRKCLDTMINALIELERKQRGPESSTILVLTVCTTPSRFPSMWSWLKARTQGSSRKNGSGGR
jgi:ribosomal protein S18 acetylase RimI-like enzyme